jgi:aromatic-L-amino-acid decarboxylase
VIDYRDWQIPLGRRFRALKLWATVRWYGAEGLRNHIRSGVSLAQGLAEWIDADPDFELAAPVPLSLVCFRHVGGDDVNQHLLDAVNASGRAYLTHTRLDDRMTLRVAIGQPHTGTHHLRELWDLIQATAAGSPASAVR